MQISRRWPWSCMFHFGHFGSVVSVFCYHAPESFSTISVLCCARPLFTSRCFWAKFFCFLLLLYMIEFISFCYTTLFIKSFCHRKINSQIMLWSSRYISDYLDIDSRREKIIYSCHKAFTSTCTSSTSLRCEKLFYFFIFYSKASRAWITVLGQLRHIVKMKLSMHVLTRWRIGNKISNPQSVRETISLKWGAKS